MARARMRLGTRFAKEMLATRIPVHLFDRLRAYAASSRYTIEEIVATGIEEHLDKVAPHTKARFAPEVVPGSAPGVDLTQLSPAQIEQLRGLILGTQEPARRRGKG